MIARIGLASLTLLLALNGPADAAESLNGGAMSLWWGLPFAGLLLCIATGPLLFHHLWEQRMGVITAFWAACVVIPLLMTAGTGGATEAVLHTLLLEYVPFILLLLALFVTAGGIYVEGNLHGSPALNTGLLAIGTAMASAVGTTGASMILIRPLIRANDERNHRVHTVVFFIFLVSNIGGGLTPLGDPPLFVGFLKGVDFFWTTIHMAAPLALLAVLLLAGFFVLDTILYRRETFEPHHADPTPDDSKLQLHGLVNLPLIAVVIGAILMSAAWKPGIDLRVGGVAVPLQNIVRDVIFLLVAFASLKLTPARARAGNDFNWLPIREVAILFAGIFLCLVPVIAILHAGKDGALAPLLALVTRPDGSPDNLAYFWMTGTLSSFLDNAPTYLVFFELAGGDARTLMTTLAPTLLAISMGAVFMGANTYIGNAPNFMVYAIARQQGVPMPGFFGYMLWSAGILLPLFALAGWLFLGRS